MSFPEVAVLLYCLARVFGELGLQGFVVTNNQLGCLESSTLQNKFTDIKGKLQKL